MYFTVCCADSEIRDGCNCTRRTASTPPARFRAGFIVEASFPLGWRAAAGGRPEGDRPPAQRESQNYRRGLSTAER
ncbi:hypothetical protein NDU88_010986 [Pleurodeles waltl]|uniref:Uncharacterized protein n=1 Tax=Pleurodeles waltl TaxID=8319 RepID=A0AAV7QVX6_PLEWA|nr:hypothetical protein NDU88_010986 [Pleurodeles waltl]